METDTLTPSLMLITLIAVLVIAAGAFAWFLHKRHNRELAVRAFDGGDVGEGAASRDERGAFEGIRYEVHSSRGGAAQAIRRPEALSALNEAVHREMRGHDRIAIVGSGGRSFTIDEFGREVSGSGEREPAKRLDVLGRMGADELTHEPG